MVLFLVHTVYEERHSRSNSHFCFLLNVCVSLQLLWQLIAHKDNLYLTFCIWISYFRQNIFATIPRIYNIVYMCYEKYCSFRNMYHVSRIQPAVCVLQITVANSKNSMFYWTKLFEWLQTSLRFPHLQQTRLYSLVTVHCSVRKWNISNHSTGDI